MTAMIGSADCPPPPGRHPGRAAPRRGAPAGRRPVRRVRRDRPGSGAGRLPDSAVRPGRPVPRRGRDRTRRRRRRHDPADRPDDHPGGGRVRRRHAGRPGPGVPARHAAGPGRAADDRPPGRPPAGGVVQAGRAGAERSPPRCPATGRAPPCCGRSTSTSASPRATINYGASPGDDHIADPYLYVGPHDGPPPGDPAFWNAPFGAARTFRQIGTVAEAAAFFRDGRARALAAAAATPIRRTS